MASSQPCYVAFLLELLLEPPPAPAPTTTTHAAPLRQGPLGGPLVPSIPSVWSLFVCLAVLIRVTVLLVPEDFPSSAWASERWKVGGRVRRDVSLSTYLANTLLSEQPCLVGCSNFAEGIPPHTFGEIRADPKSQHRRPSPTASPGSPGTEM